MSTSSASDGHVLLLKVAAGACSLVALGGGHTLAGLTLGAIAVLAWRPLRYPLIWAAMAGIRRYVVRNVRPNAGQLPEPGAVSDPDAPWRHWLDPAGEYV